MSGKAKGKGRGFLVDWPAYDACELKLFEIQIIPLGCWVAYRDAVVVASRGTRVCKAQVFREWGREGGCRGNMCQKQGRTQAAAVHFQSTKGKFVGLCTSTTVPADKCQRWRGAVGNYMQRTPQGHAREAEKQHVRV